MMLIHRGKKLLGLKMDSVCDVEISNDCFGNVCESRPLGNAFGTNMMKFVVIINDRDDQIKQVLVGRLSRK